MKVKATALGLFSLAVASIASASLMTEEMVAPIVDIGVAVNPGPNVERELCLRIALGAAASAECGDLRISHALPTTTTFNRARTPILSYSSHQAHPYPLLRANVMLPGGAAVPDSVTMKLFWDGGATPIAQETWDGDEWSPGDTRRTVLGFDADSIDTGLYPYSVRVTNHYGPVEDSASVAGEMAIVNRERSPFGSGWWLLGLEQLLNVPGQSSKKLWIGGDGSTRVYTDQGSGVWTTPNRSRPDTIKAVGATFERLLPGKIKVVFDANGRHTRTVPRLSNQDTEFAYDGSGRLSTVTLPVPTGAASRVYTFNYGIGASGFFLASVSAPSVGGTARSTAMVQGGGSSGMLTRITDPDGGQVDFTEDSTFARRIVERLNRGVGSSNTRVPTEFTFNRLNQVESSRLDPGLGQDSIVLSIDHGDALSLDHLAPMATAVKTVIDGPRTDVPDLTTFSLTGFGAPDTITDAIGGRTTFTRGESGLPALVTRVVHPNGRQMDAGYDDRGNVDRLEDNGPDGSSRVATTISYTNTSYPDFPTLIVQPSGEQTIIAYDADGNRSSQKDGRATSGATFAYYDNASAYEGLLRQIDGSETDPNLIEYDTYGNVDAVVTPEGIRTDMVRDNIGRLVETRIPVVIDYDPNTTGTRIDSLYYDLQDRVTKSVRRGPTVEFLFPAGGAFPAAHADSGDVVNETTTYDREGNPLNVSIDDPAVLGEETNRNFTYDQAGRVRTRSKGDDDETLTYDGASNVRTVLTPHGSSITMVYDTLNRLKSRTIPGITYSSSTCDGPIEGLLEASLPAQCDQNYEFPLYANNLDGSYEIPGDVQTFTYNSVGNLLTANNRYAQITRDYHVNGLIKSEQLQIRSMVGDTNVCATTDPDGPTCTGTFSDHDFLISYTYDRNGRVRSITYPSEVISGSMQLTYDSTSSGSGLLKNVSGPQSTTFAYAYDGENRVTQIDFPGSVTEIRQYDDDSRLIDRTISRVTLGDFLNEDMTYDVQGKIETASSVADGVGRSFLHRYSGLGALIGSNVTGGSGGSFGQERFEMDGLGNQITRRREDPSQGTGVVTLVDYTYEAGRMMRNVVTAPETLVPGTYPVETALDFDLAGNAIANVRVEEATDTAQISSIQQAMISRSYHSVDDRLMARQQFIDQVVGSSPPKDGSFDEFWYDALGRRIQVRSRQDDSDLCTNQGVGVGNDCKSFIERTVWSGNQVLGELRGPGATRSSAATLNVQSGGSDGPSVQFGSVAYVHGIGLDHPLAIIKGGSTVLIPHSDFKGGYFGATTTTGAVSPVDVRWPGERRRAFLDRRFFDTLDEGVWVGNAVMGFADPSGLLYRRNRYYDPLTGQFTQEDPIGLGGGANLYGFAQSDPVNLSDPFGLCPWCLGAIAGGALAIIDVALDPNEKLFSKRGLLKVGTSTVIGGLSGGLSVVGQSTVRGTAAVLTGQAALGAGEAIVTSAIGGNLDNLGSDALRGAVFGIVGEVAGNAFGRLRANEIAELAAEQADALLSAGFRTDDAGALADGLARILGELNQSRENREGALAGFVIGFIGILTDGG